MGIDVSRFNTMIISSMPRNIASIFRLQSRVARRVESFFYGIIHLDQEIFLIIKIQRIS
ncbi:MAG: hypothetical protein IPJ32_19465 [Sphingobacteriaceae bacterium]|nr:hypothetical protein [Sphingobacteriaceae bacterium]